MFCLCQIIVTNTFARLERKVDKMEHSIGSIITKLDAVLVRLGVMQEGEFRQCMTSCDLMHVTSCDLI